jgi:hypothetical protein
VCRFSIVDRLGLRKCRVVGLGQLRHLPTKFRRVGRRFEIPENEFSCCCSRDHLCRVKKKYRLSQIAEFVARRVERLDDGRCSVDSSLALRLSHSFVQFGIEAAQTSSMRPLIEQHLCARIRDELRRLTRIELQMMLLGILVCQFQRAQRSIAFRCPIPNGNNLNVNGDVRSQRVQLDDVAICLTCGLCWLNEAKYLASALNVTVRVPLSTSK